MKKILIIDDEEKIRDIYRDTLTREGYEVLEAYDLTQGIARIFFPGNVDLVLLDIKMPSMGGGRIMDIIDDYDLHFKIIVSSVYSVEEQKYVIPGADDYFDKVQGIDVLIGKVKKVLEGAS